MAAIIANPKRTIVSGLFLTIFFFLFEERKEGRQNSVMGKISIDGWNIHSDNR